MKGPDIKRLNLMIDAIDAYKLNLTSKLGAMINMHRFVLAAKRYSALPQCCRLLARVCYYVKDSVELLQDILKGARNAGICINTAVIHTEVAGSGTDTAIGDLF